LKRIRNSSIKQEMRRHINGILQKTSDDFVDLIEKMLTKEAATRIEVLDIYDHPWMVRYRNKAENWSDEDNVADSSSSLESQTS